MEVAFIRFLALTGCRKGEARGLRWEWLLGQAVRLPDSKTGPRSVWIGAAAQRVLDELPRTWPLVFSRDGRETADHNLKGLGGGVRKKARLNGLRIHELRHSFASIALGRGESMRTVAGLLGHSEVQTTLGYAHLVEAPVKEATERVSSYIASQIKPHRPNSQYRQNNSQASRTHTSGDQGFSAVRQDHQNVLRETRLGPRYVPPRHQGVAPERAEVMSLRND